MKDFINTFKQKNMICGYLYFYIHFVTEIACFYFLSKVTNNANFIWLIPLIYDGMAFVPQSIIGNLNDKYPKLDVSLIGTILMLIAYFGYFYSNQFFLKGNAVYVFLIILCLGNAFIHIGGAENTLKVSEGKLSHSAIFVGGGSFGVILGRLIATSTWGKWWMIVLLMLTMIPYILLAKTYVTGESNCNNFKYVNLNIKPGIIIVLAIFVVVVRGYMGYGIPASWNKTVIQSVIFYFTMGIGKALGGILSDSFGIRKVAFLSTVLAIPFLCLGDNYMLISLIGVMLFSMTMSITLAILVSVLRKKPGLAFGLTTIGLFLGTVPIFFVKLTTIMNIAFIVIMSLVCTNILMFILNKEKIDEKGKVENAMDL